MINIAEVDHSFEMTESGKIYLIKTFKIGTFTLTGEDLST